ncbi:MAG: hypothetical protein Q4B42_01140 [Oscillospiraceae bacterium]|nr:hypothetical protein [Oscillospiraceae bacterium]
MKKSAFSALLNSSEKALAIILVALLLLSLIPLCIAASATGFYNDEYVCGHEVALIEGGDDSLFSSFIASVKRTYQYYYKWQGSFAAVFFMTQFNPVVLGASEGSFYAYFFFLIYIVGWLVLGWAVFCRLLKLELSTASVLTLPMIILGLQFVPSAAEGFFWFTGAAYYTFFFALSLVFWGLAAFFLKANGRKAKTLLCIALSLIALSLGASNYVTALQMSLLLALCVLASFVLKRHRVISCALFGLEALAFAVSAFAPGNGARQEAFGEAASFFGTVSTALRDGLIYIRQWTTPYVVIALLIMLPSAIKLAYKVNFDFRLPLPAIAVGAGIVCSGLAPVYYASNVSWMPERILNLIYWSYGIWVFFSFIYTVGWVVKKLEKLRAQTGEGLPLQALKRFLPEYYLLLAAASSVIFAYPLLQERPLSVRILESVASGSLAAYSELKEAQLETLEDENIREAVLKAAVHIPDFYIPDDVSYDPNTHTNKQSYRLSLQ